MQDNEYTDSGICCENCRWWMPFAGACCNPEFKFRRWTSCTSICDKWEGNDIGG